VTKLTDAKEARVRLGLTQEQMGSMLGYQGDHVRQMVYEIETGRKPLMPCQRRLLEAYLEGYRPRDWPANPPTG
jgi:transcriptional regulator with XRE-family HTH domain